ncbi:DUF998 domain-containing protein [Dactylosporangium sp. NPDC005572]|uniref:DUF998 domain-containing protein n=1 Tax=Dactylosporangium sp. NPDC005572 TaxID=3156889 RepID=UPI0033BA1E59
MAVPTSARSETTPDNRRTTRLITCGAVAGVVFIGVSFAQAFARPGFELRRHALSALTLGGLGWVQVMNFVVTGLLAGACALGLRQALRFSRAGTAGPILVGVYGVAMIGGGIFTPDPALGWPPGAPAGLPVEPSVNSVVHTVFGAMAFLSLIAAGLVFARRFAGQGHRGWAAYSCVSSLAAFILTALPWNEESASVRFAAGAVVISSWLVALSCRIRRERE